MFTVKMFLDQVFVHRQIRVDAVGNIGHFSYLFHHHCIMHSIMSIFSPREWAMILD